MEINDCSVAAAHGTRTTSFLTDTGIFLAHFAQKNPLAVKNDVVLAPCAAAAAAGIQRKKLVTERNRRCD